MLIKPNKIWASDVTCFKLKDKYYYICAIVDLFSRRVIAHKISLRNNTHLITSTFKLAYAERNPSKEFVFYSDQGSQFTSHSFQKLLQKHDARQSFSKRGKPHDNAVIESFFATLKLEEIYRSDYSSEASFRKGIDEFIIFYNTKQIHTALNHKTPVEVENQFNL